MHCSDNGVNAVAEWMKEDDGTIRHQSSWMIQGIDEEGQQIVFGECCEHSSQSGKITIRFSHTICPISFSPYQRLSSIIISFITISLQHFLIGFAHPFISLSQYFSRHFQFCSFHSFSSSHIRLVLPFSIKLPFHFNCHFNSFHSF